jgi:hypothetical protein
LLTASVIRAIAASTSETSVVIYQTARRNNPEDSHFHIHRRDNLKSSGLNVRNIPLPKNHAL